MESKNRISITDFRTTQLALNKLWDSIEQLPIQYGTGIPENNVIGDKGSMYWRVVNGSIVDIYIKEGRSGTAKGWTRFDMSASSEAIDINDYITGTSNQITVTDDGDNTCTLSLPQAIGLSADVQFDSLILGDLTGDRLVESSSSGLLQSVDIVDYIAGTVSQITVTDDTDGTVTLSLPQDIDTTSSPTFADLTISTPVNIYSLSHDSFSGFVSNEHINHSGVSVVAAGTNSGLTTSNNDLTSNIGLSVDINGTADLAAPATGDEILLADVSDSNTVKKADLASVLALGAGASAVPSGCVQAFAGSSVPTGWLNCDGSAVSRSTYSDLFTAIGTTWGVGDGSTTFNLPDLRSATIRGVGTPTVFTYNNAVALADTIDDQFQAWQTGGESASVARYGNLATFADTSGTDLYGRYQSSGQGAADMIVAYNDGTHGDPRTGYETTGKARGLYWIIKT